MGECLGSHVFSLQMQIIFFIHYFQSGHRFIAVSSSLSQPRQAVMTVTMTQMITTSMNTMRSIFPATLSFEFLQSVFSFLGCSSKKQHMMIAVATMQTNTVWTRMIPVVYSILYLKNIITVKNPKRRPLSLTSVIDK